MINHILRKGWIDLLVIAGWISVWTLLAYLYPFGEMIIN